MTQDTNDANDLPGLPVVQGDDDPLYQVALAVEQDARVAAEMAEWEAATVADGLRPAHPRARRR